MRSRTFSERLFKESKYLLQTPKRKKEMLIVFDRTVRHLLGENDPNDNQPIRKYTNRQKYLVNLFREYYEIKQSLDRIEQSRKFISNIPRSAKKLDYIRYHYEFYLNELYIFYCRTNHLLDFLITTCQKKKLFSEITTIRNVKNSIKTSMAGVLKTRGRHVHKRRYENNKMDQISALELFSEKFDVIEAYKDTELRKFKKDIKMQILLTHKHLSDFLDKDLYKHLGKIIFGTILKSQ